jgi:hypothetical protein
VFFDGRAPRAAESARLRAPRGLLGMPDATGTPRRQLTPRSSSFLRRRARCWLLVARRRELTGKTRGERTACPGACTCPLTRAPGPAPAQHVLVRRTRENVGNMSAVSGSGALRPHWGCGVLRTRRARPPREARHASPRDGCTQRSLLAAARPLQILGDARGRATIRRGGRSLTR